MVKSQECELVTNSESEISFQYFEPQIIILAKQYAFVLFEDSNRKKKTEITKPIEAQLDELHFRPARPASVNFLFS